MEKENKLKYLKLSNFFTSSCKTQNLLEVIDHNKTHIINPQNPKIQNYVVKQEKHIFHNLVNINPKQINPQTFNQNVQQKCKCPPTSPASPLFQKQRNGNNNNNNIYSKQTQKTINKAKTTHFRKNGFKQNPFCLSSSNETDDNGDWFSSDDERKVYEKQTLFSLKSHSFSSRSISFSSDDSDNQTQTQTQTRIKTRPQRRKPGLRVKEVGVEPLQGKVKDTFAIVKRSSDPYNDFKKSMVEMIIEKQIFRAKELEHLLECFISLNSSHHHRVIVEVFSEICHALFSHFS